MIDNVYRLVKITEKDERTIAAVQFEIKLFVFFYRSQQLTDYIFMDIYCKLSKCIGQTPCSYEHYLVSITDQESFDITSVTVCLDGHSLVRSVIPSK